MPKHYKLKKGQLYMVKNAKMFKERFQTIYDELLRQKTNRWGYKSTIMTEEEGFERDESPSDESIALLVLKKVLPKITFNENKRLIENNILDTFPDLAETIRTNHIKRAKELNKDRKAFEAKVEKTYKELLDKVLFNGKDPLEAINELQALAKK